MRAANKIKRLNQRAELYSGVQRVLSKHIGKGAAWSALGPEAQRVRVQSVLRPAIKAVEGAGGGLPVGELLDIGTSVKRAAKTKAVREARVKNEGHAEFLAVSERDRAERSALASFGLGVSIRKLKELQRSESLEDRDEAVARAPRKQRKRNRAVRSTWLLGARAVEGYAERVGIEEEAHRLLSCQPTSPTPEQLEFDVKKMEYYLELVLDEIARHAGVHGMPLTDLREVLACEAEALQRDPNHTPAIMLHVDWTHLANRLGVAAGGEGRTLHRNDGGLVVKDILRDGNVPLECFALKVKQGNRPRRRRRGAKKFKLADGRVVRRERAVSDDQRKASLEALIAHGDLDMGYSKPPRVNVVTRDEGEAEHAEPQGNTSQILPVRKRLRARLDRMAHLRLLRWRPPFYDADALPPDEVARLLAEEIAHARASHASIVREIAGRIVAVDELDADKRARLRKLWELNRSVRSQPAPRPDAPKCGVFCDECDTVECCSECGLSVAAFACQCRAARVLRCWRCARLGVNGDQAVRAALQPYGINWTLMNQCRTHAERYERLVILERMHEISVLLVELGQDAWLDGEGTGPHDPIDPLDGPREARLRTAQNRVQLGSWTDGSPMLNTGWMLSLNQIMYDPAKFEHGACAEKECRRPMLHHLAQGGDTLEEVKYGAGLRLEDWQTLNTPQPGPWGVSVEATVRFLLGDLPEIQKNQGVSNGGQQACTCCVGRLHEHGNLCMMCGMPLRDWKEPLRLAKKLASIPAYELRFGPSIGTAADIVAMLRALGKTPASTRKENEPRVRAALQGCTNAPAFYGSNWNAVAEVFAILHLTSFPDYALHSLKGLLAYLFETLEAALPPALRAELDARFDELHKGGATVKSGYHRRLELVHAPWLLRAPLREPLGELAEAMDCLALVMAWGVRVPHVRWHAYRHHCVLITNVCMFKFAVLLLRCVPLTKKTKRGEQPRALFGMFFHQLVSHLGSDIKYACPLHTMAEWFEMLWGPLRHLTLATSSRDTKHALLNMVRRLQVKELWDRLHGTRSDLASASHTDQGAVAKGLQEHYGSALRGRIELDERFTSSEHFPALIAKIPEYLETGLWHHVEERGSLKVVVFHTAADDTNHAQPSRQHFRTANAASVCVRVRVRVRVRGER